MGFKIYNIGGEQFFLINPQTLWTDFQYHDDLFRDIVDYETLMQMDKDYMVERTQEKWKTWRDTFLNTDSLTSTAKEIMQPLIDSGAWDRNARRWRNLKIQKI